MLKKIGLSQQEIIEESDTQQQELEEQDENDSEP